MGVKKGLRINSNKEICFQIETRRYLIIERKSQNNTLTDFVTLVSDFRYHIYSYNSYFNTGETYKCKLLWKVHKRILPTLSDYLEYCTWSPLTVSYTIQDHRKVKLGSTGCWSMSRSVLYIRYQQSVMYIS